MTTVSSNRRRIPGTRAPQQSFGARTGGIRGCRELDDDDLDASILFMPRTSQLGRNDLSCTTKTRPSMRKTVDGSGLRGNMTSRLSREEERRNSDAPLAGQVGKHLQRRINTISKTIDMYKSKMDSRMAEMPHLDTRMAHMDRKPGLSYRTETGNMKRTLTAGTRGGTRTGKKAVAAKQQSSRHTKSLELGPDPYVASKLDEMISVLSSGIDFDREAKSLELPGDCAPSGHSDSRGPDHEYEGPSDPDEHFFLTGENSDQPNSQMTSTMLDEEQDIEATFIGNLSKTSSKPNVADEDPGSARVSSARVSNNAGESASNMARPSVESTAFNSVRQGSPPSERDTIPVVNAVPSNEPRTIPASSPYRNPNLGTVVAPSEGAGYLQTDGGTTDDIYDWLNSTPRTSAPAGKSGVSSANYRASTSWKQATSACVGSSSGSKEPLNKLPESLDPTKWHTLPSPSLAVIRQWRDKQIGGQLAALLFLDRCVESEDDYDTLVLQGNRSNSASNSLGPLQTLVGLGRASMTQQSYLSTRLFSKGYEEALQDAMAVIERVVSQKEIAYATQTMKITSASSRASNQPGKITITSQTAINPLNLGFAQMHLRASLTKKCEERLLLQAQAEIVRLHFVDMVQGGVGNTGSNQSREWNDRIMCNLLSSEGIVKFADIEPQTQKSISDKTPDGTGATSKSSTLRKRRAPLIPLTASYSSSSSSNAVPLEVLRFHNERLESYLVRAARLRDDMKNLWGSFDRNDAYAVLGLESFNVSIDDVKKAYHKLARTMHPDKGGDPGAFQIIQKAYSAIMAEHKNIFTGDFNVASTEAQSTDEQDPDGKYDESSSSRRNSRNDGPKNGVTPPSVKKYNPDDGIRREGSTTLGRAIPGTGEFFSDDDLQTAENIRNGSASASTDPQERSKFLRGLASNNFNGSKAAEKHFFGNPNMTGETANGSFADATNPEKLCEHYLQECQNSSKLAINAASECASEFHKMFRQTCLYHSTNSSSGGSSNRMMSKTTTSAGGGASFGQLRHLMHDLVNRSIIETVRYFQDTAFHATISAKCAEDLLSHERMQGEDLLNWLSLRDRSQLVEEAANSCYVMANGLEKIRSAVLATIEKVDAIVGNGDREDSKKMGHKLFLSSVERLEQTAHRAAEEAIGCGAKSVELVKSLASLLSELQERRRKAEEDAKKAASPDDSEESANDRKEVEAAAASGGGGPAKGPDDFFDDGSSQRKRTGSSLSETANRLKDRHMVLRSKNLNFIVKVNEETQELQQKVQALILNNPKLLGKIEKQHKDGLFTLLLEIFDQVLFALNIQELVHKSIYSTPAGTAGVDAGYAKYISTSRFPNLSPIFAQKLRKTLAFLYFFDTRLAITTDVRSKIVIATNYVDCQLLGECLNSLKSKMVTQLSAGVESYQKCFAPSVSKNSSRKGSTETGGFLWTDAALEDHVGDIDEVFDVIQNKLHEVLVGPNN